GLRERIVRVEAPPGLPFDHGKFELLLESIDAPSDSVLISSGQRSGSTILASEVRTDLVTLTSAISPARRRAKVTTSAGLSREPAGQQRRKADHSPSRGRPSQVRLPRHGENLKLCRGCNQYITPRTQTCPHCGSDIKEAQIAYSKELRRARRLEKRLADLMNI